MGSEDLFHKKRERLAKDLRRKKQSRDKQPKILIVCEDSKSSAFYLEDLAEDLGLSGVKVKGRECGSAPISVVSYTIAEYAKSKETGDAYDRVYCVFDRDQHDGFDEAVLKVKNIVPKGKFFTITTTPCFEFWLLLHFGQTSASFVTKGKKSPCDCANEALKVDDKLPNYGKNKRQIYVDTKHKLVDAIKHAKQLSLLNQETGSENPQTNMHELIEYLQSIKR
ncbi:MAG: RloB family protein [Methylotenera sp.]